MSLQTPIEQALGTNNDRANVIGALWRNGVPIIPEEADAWGPYLAYYEDECMKASEGRRRFTTVKQHADVVSIFTRLEKDCTKRDLKDTLIALDTRGRQRSEMEGLAEGSIRLVVRLAAMVDSGPMSAKHYASYSPVKWTDESMNLTTSLRKQFPESSSVPEASIFGRLFNALNIRRYAGLKIQWTDNLANHLRLVDDDTTLCIFHHVTFLRNQTSAIFPHGLLEETLQTLMLLFPRNNNTVQKWLEREAKSMRDTTRLDMGLLKLGVLRPEERRVEKFRFWRDELIELKERFVQPSLTTLRQFWFDRRNRVQWYTFWVAMLVLLLTIFFGLVQSVEGAMQVYKAYYPTE